MTNEIWLPIKGYKQSYKISNFGRVKSLTRKVKNSINSTRIVRERILKPFKAGEYQAVSLQSNHTYIHILVLETFIGLKPRGMEACHFPRNDKTDNRLCNLQWGTPKKNQEHRLIHGTDSCGEKQINSKLSEAQVREIRKDRRTMTVLSKIYGVSRSSISLIKSRKNW